MRSRLPHPGPRRSSRINPTRPSTRTATFAAEPEDPGAGSATDAQPTTNVADDRRPVTRTELHDAFRAFLERETERLAAAQEVPATLPAPADSSDSDDEGFAEKAALLRAQARIPGRGSPAGSPNGVAASFSPPPRAGHDSANLEYERALRAELLGAPFREQQRPDIARTSDLDGTSALGHVAPPGDAKVPIRVRLRQLLEDNDSGGVKIHPCQAEITKADVAGEQESRVLSDTHFNWWELKLRALSAKKDELAFTRLRTVSKNSVAKLQAVLYTMSPQDEGYAVMEELILQTTLEVEYLKGLVTTLGSWQHAFAAADACFDPNAFIAAVNRAWAVAQNKPSELAKAVESVQSSALYAQLIKKPPGWFESNYKLSLAAMSASSSAPPNPSSSVAGSGMPISSAKGGKGGKPSANAHAGGRSAKKRALSAPRAAEGDE